MEGERAKGEGTKREGGRIVIVCPMIIEISPYAQQQLDSSTARNSGAWASAIRKGNEKEGTGALCMGAHCTTRCTAKPNHVVLLFSVQQSVLCFCCRSLRLSCFVLRLQPFTLHPSPFTLRPFSHQPAIGTALHAHAGAGAVRRCIIKSKKV